MSELDIFAAARRWPNRLALVAGREAFSYAELARLSLAARETLVATLGQLDPERPVAWIADTSASGIATLLALWSQGIPVCPLHPAATDIERTAQLATVEPQAVLSAAWQPRHTAAEMTLPPSGPAVREESPLVILFTSGSGGTARPVSLSRRAFVAAANASAKHLGWRAQDRWLLTLPLAHVGGLSVISRCLIGGKTIVVPPSGADSEEAVQFASRQRVTMASLVPTQLHRWLDSPNVQPWPELRAVLVGGARTSSDLFAQGQKRGFDLLRTYGLTEACSQVATADSGAPSRGASDCGRPLPGYEVRTDGERILIRSPSLLSGYWGSAEVPLLEGGWLATQDRGFVDEAGHVHVQGRLDDAIIVGGENVDPLEVEAAIGELPAVRVACAFGIPEAAWGTRLAIVVEPQPGMTLPETELRSYAQRHLARHKRPRLWCTVGKLPLTPSGKVDRQTVMRSKWIWRELSYSQ